MTRVAVLALVLVGCGDDLSARDYSDTACPMAVVPTSYAPDVCDRGVGYSPRYVAVEACLAELHLAVGRSGFGLASTHPRYSVCRPTVLLFTIADVARGQGLVAAQ